MLWLVLLGRDLSLDIHTVLIHLILEETEVFMNFQFHGKEEMVQIVLDALDTQNNFFL